MRHFDFDDRSKSVCVSYQKDWMRPRQFTQNLYPAVVHALKPFIGIALVKRVTLGHSFSIRHFSSELPRKMPCNHHLLSLHLEQEVFASSACESASSSAGGPFASEKAVPSYAPNNVLEPKHMAVHLSFDIPKQTVQGFVRHTINNPRHTPIHEGSVLARELSQITFNAVSLDISAVVDTADGSSLDFDYDGKEIKVRFPAAFKPEETKIIEIRYKAENPIAGLYFHVPDEVLKEKVLHCITDHETERARYWLPCVDFPAVRTSLEFHLTAPKDLIALANGAETGIKDNGDGTRTTSFALASLCPSYLICLAVGDFVEAVDESVDGMPVKYYAPKNISAKDLMTTFGRTPAMVRWLQRKVGLKFPWPKYYQIVSPEINGGAMENISLVTYTDRLCIDEVAAKDFVDTVDSVNIHEMAHTYFGDLLVMRHFEHAWLKESWATYISSCWLEDHASHEMFRYDIISNIKNYIAETASYIRPIVTRTYDSSWNMFDSHLYPGGAVRIHMLRHLLGDEVFWSAVKNYVNTFANKVVETEDFKRFLEQESGLNLTRFFDQWFYGLGFPKLKATYEYVAARKQVQVVLEQTQVSKKDNIPVFDITIEVDIIDADGKVFTVQVPFEENNPRAVAIVPLGEAKPSIVEIDPRGKVLHSLEFNPGEQILESTIKGGRDIGSRIHAYKELIKIGSISALKKVKECLPLEQFFGVRTQAYLALSAAKTQTAVDILASSLATETHPRALTALLSACTIRAESIRKGILKLLENPSALTYNARAQAFTNLGRQRNPADLPFLIAAASDPVIGTAGVVRAGVITAIGHLRTPEAHQFLLSNLPRGSQPERGQTAVFSALSTSGQWVDRLERRKTAEAISEYLRDPFHRIRRAALGALKDLEGKEFAGAAAATLAGFPAQDRPAVEKVVKGIREADPSGEKVKEMAATIEDLEGRLKKMEQQMQLLEARQKEEAEAKAKEVKEKEADIKPVTV